jgi:putative glutathione S-transferase
MAEVYAIAEPQFDGVVTVPVLWDKQRETIVNNESSEIMRILNSAFDDCGGRRDVDLYPEALRDEIDEANEFVYDKVNNGVYQVGFATTQEAYDVAFDQLFAGLDELELQLEGGRYLVADQATEADWRLFTSLLRFDPVYYSHFKCNRQRLVDFPNLWAYTRRLYQMPGVAETVNMDHIKRHYYSSHKQLNPSGIVPKGPVIDFSEV